MSDGDGKGQASTPCTNRLALSHDTSEPDDHGSATPLPRQTTSSSAKKTTGSDKDFFKSDHTHSLAKRVLYKKYLQGYIPIMLNAKDKSKTLLFDKIRILDGFAGTGQYETNGWPDEIEKYGSPIIALRVAIDHYKKELELPMAFNPAVDDTQVEVEELDKVARSKEETITCEEESISHRIILTFVERKKKYFQQLVRNVLTILKMYGIDQRVQKQNCCTYKVDLMHAHLPIVCYIVLAEFHQMAAPPDPCLAFIDPFGFKQIPMYRMKDFVRQSREVLITLMSSYVNRFISITPECVGRLFGLNMPQGKDRDEMNANLKEMVLGKSGSAEKCVQNYERRLKSEAGTEYALTFEMRRKSNDSIIYHLVFVTNHLKGLKVMKDSMMTVTQEPEKKVVSDFIIKKGIPFQLGIKQTDEEVAAAIFNKHKTSENVSFGSVEMYVWLNTPFVFRKKALAILEKEGSMEVEVTNEHENKRRRGTFPDWAICNLTFSEHRLKCGGPETRQNSKKRQSAKSDNGDQKTPKRKKQEVKKGVAKH